MQAMNTYPFSLEFKNDSLGIPLYATFPFFVNGTAQKGISCYVSSRYAGDMKFDEANQNRKALFAGLGLKSGSVFGVWQIHSRSVLVVDRDNPPREKADGLVTRDCDVTLSVTVADCLPVFLYDTKTGAFGLVHSGWKGTGIALDAINLMKANWGTKADDVAAVLGPCIGVCCYNVDAERAAIFKNEFGAESVLCSGRESGGDYFLDLKAANIRLLSEAGVRNIAVCTDCTFTDERLGSFRRQGADYTRMAALIYSE